MLQPRIIHAPGFAKGDWLNTETPYTNHALRGQVVLVEFWDYTSFHCMRMLPYLKGWHERYSDRGLTIVGVHSPEFSFAHSRHTVEEAVRAFDLPYPILLDNGLQTWQAFANTVRPTRYLVDAAGYIRFQAYGADSTRQTEAALQMLLRERDPNVELPALMPAPDQQSCAQPRLYAGYFQGALGNREGYAAEGTLAYRLPIEWERTEASFYVEGFWRAEAEAMVFAGRELGRVMLPYTGQRVHAVLSPSNDPVEVILGLRPTDQEPLIEVYQDGHPLTPLNAGADVHAGAEGSILAVNRARAFELVNNPAVETHELELCFRASGLSLYSFTVSGCVA
ncbi:MAG: redoxin domain-containing protein [Anaerolineae bacterium]